MTDSEKLKMLAEIFKAKENSNRKVAEIEEKMGNEKTALYYHELASNMMHVCECIDNENFLNDMYRIWCGGNNGND